MHTFPTDDGGVDMKCPTEIAITDRREAELAKNGFMPLVHRKNTRLRRVHRRAVAAEAERVRRPGRDRQRQPVGAPAVPVRVLPLRALPEVHRARQDRLLQGARPTWRSWLQHWIMQYVDGDPANSSEETKAQQAAGGGRGRGRGGRGQPGLLHVQVLPAAALPARGYGVAAARLEAALVRKRRNFGSTATRYRQSEDSTWQS